MVADTNILFSFFKRSSTARRIISGPEYFELYTPDFSITELKKHRGDICKKSLITPKEFAELLGDMISLFVNVVPLSEYSGFLSKAVAISPDKDDVDFFALALKLRCLIWSNELKLKNQPAIKVMKTAEIVNLLDPLRK